MKLDADQLFHIEQALIMYIDYLRDGDDDDKETAKNSIDNIKQVC